MGGIKNSRRPGGMEPDTDFDKRTRAKLSQDREQESRICYILRREATGPGKKIMNYRIQCHPCNKGPENAPEEREI